MAVGMVVIALAIFTIADAGDVARFLANRILANAVRPTGFELPPTAYAIPFSSDDIQVIGGRGEGLGCSIPPPVHALVFSRFGQIAPIELEMRQACVAHDYCYRHGAATYGYTQDDCDFTLQQQAFRLCRFIETKGKKVATEDDRQSNDRCLDDARVITLGVRAAGSDSFRHLDVADEDIKDFWGYVRPFDTKGSTYFEYDPYPVKSSIYQAYRLADAPASQKGRKALYVFEVRPSGMTVHVISWVNHQSRELATYELRGQQRILTRPPIVVRSGSGSGSGSGSESGEDWFLWWQRYGLTKTGARAVLLAPARATGDDWKKADEAFPADLKKGCVNASSSAVAILYVGQNPCDDANVADVFAAPNMSPGGSLLRVMALRIQACTDPKKLNAICFTDMVLDPSRGASQKTPMPDQAVDRFGYDEKDRYRNFTSAPILFGDSTEPGLAWFRRGGPKGKGYKDSATVRRMTVKDRGTPQETGLSLGAFNLKDFAEDDEPVIVSGRHFAPPRFLSVRVRDGGFLAWFGQPKSIIRQWTWPASGPDAPDDLMTPSEQPCNEQFDSSWQVRPPLALGDIDGTLLVASRVSIPADGKSFDDALLHLATMRVSRDGRCGKMSEKLQIPLKSLAPQAKKDDLRKFIWSLRSQPLLIGNLDDDVHLDLVVPNPTKMAESYVAWNILDPFDRADKPNR